VTHLECLCLCNVIPVCDHSRVETLGNVSVCLLQQLSYKQHDRCGAVARYVVLGRGRSCDHDLSHSVFRDAPESRRHTGQLLAVLGLSTAGTYHLLQQNASVFCEFDLATLSVHARRAGNVDVRLQHHRPAYTRSVARLGEFSDSVLTSSVCRGVPGWKQGPGKAISTCCGAIETAAYLLQALSGRNVDAQSFPAPLCGC
jgi:hypothetical protein